MKKKVLSAVLALALVFGSAAALPQSIVTDSTSISASAETYGAYEYKVLSNGTVQITKCNSTAKSLVIPSSINGKTVTSIGSTAFSMSSTLTSVTIPDSVTEIGYGAFVACTQLATVKLGKNVEKIGMYAFGQTGLTSISIPASVTQISEYAFNKCKSLKSVTIASGKTATVDNYAFLECTALTSVDFGSTVSAIGSFAFEGCTALTSVTIPASVNSINQAAFKDCTKLTTLNLGNGVKTIANNAFLNCEGLKTVKFGTSLKSIGNSAFEECTSLTSITLMPSTTDIGTSAFAGCTALTTAVLSGVEVIGPKAFSYCRNLSKVVFCDDLRAVGEHAFFNCNKYYNIYIPSDHLKEVGKEAFGYYLDSNHLVNSVDPAVTIFSETNSQAHTYANNYSVPFKEVKSSHECKYESITVPAACTTGGYKLSICTICGNTKKSDATDANGHPSGTYYRTTAYDTTKMTSTQTGVCTVCGAEVRKTTNEAIQRLNGSNRNGTAAAISKAAYPSTNTTVFLASSENFADALAGVPLARAYDAPILLTKKDNLPAATSTEITILKASKVIILGGKDAISNNVVTALTKLGIKSSAITRISGKSRYDTSVKIAEALAKKTGSAPTEMFFASAVDFADALSVSSVAALKKVPIIYMPKKGPKVNADVTKYVQSMKKTVTKAYFIGGSDAMSDDVFKSAASWLGLTSGIDIVRVSGSNRYKTCIAVNKSFAKVLTDQSISVATGKDFPDALTGGVFAAKNASPMFLTSGNLNAEQQAYLKSKNPTRIYIFGGTSAVSDTALQNITKASVN